jgi:hypothetical protein
MGEFIDGFVRIQLRSGTEATAPADGLGCAAGLAPENSAG